MQGWFNIRKPANVRHYNTRMKKKITHDPLSYVEETFNKIQHAVIIKTLGKLGIERKIPQYDKGYLWKIHS